MDEKQLLDRLKFHEWDDFEVKEARNEVPKDVWKTVGAFSNTDGGIIVLGIKENQDGKVQIAGVENIEKIQNDFISTLRGEKFNVPLSTKGHLFDFDGKSVLLFRIHAMPIACKPIYYGGDIRNTYTRQGSGDHRCSREEINRMLREASELSSDAMVLKGYGSDDIDSETVTIYKKYLSFRDSENPFLLMDQNGFLKKLGCLTANKRLTGEQDELTMAGLLLFGKEDSIRARFPAWELDIYLVPRDDRVAQGVTWNARKIYEVNLVKTYLQAIEYLKSKIDIPFALAKDHITRTEEVPVVLALREGLVNMIIHRDYFEHGQSRIKIYHDRIEMYNPGSTPKTVKEIIADEVTEPRNPVIAKVFRMIGWAEVAGSGMMKILRNWKAAGYIEPVIENNVNSYSFKMIFPFKELSEDYRIGIKSPIKESDFAGYHLVERSLYDFVGGPVDTGRDTNNGPDGPKNGPGGPENGPDESENGPDSGPDGPKNGPGGPENGPDESENGPDSGPDGPKNGPDNGPDEPVKLAPIQEKIVELVKGKKDITISEIVELIGKGRTTIKRHMAGLKNLNVLERVGTEKKGYWKINDRGTENDTKTKNDTGNDTETKNDTEK
jgi:ATP-dependent DNA helicase RecG